MALQLYGFFHADFIRPDVYFCILGLLIGRRDSGEVLDFSSPGLLIQAFWIPLLGDFDWNVNENFDEWNTIITALACRGVQVSRNFSIGLIWRDK